MAKITILGGVGDAGQAAFFLLKNQLRKGVCSELAMYDLNPGVEGLALDVSHIPTSASVKGYHGPESLPLALQGAEIVLMCVNMPRRPGMTDEDHFHVNASIVQRFAQSVADICPKALVVIVTNPVNSMVPLAAKVFKEAGVYDPRKLFGVTTLNVGRAQQFVAELKGGDPTDVYVPVIGGTSGVTILPVLSHARMLSNGQQKLGFSPDQMEDLTQRLQNAGTEVANAKVGGTTGSSADLALGAAVCRFTHALLRGFDDERGVVECAYVDSESGATSFFAQPVLLGREGIENVIPLDLNEFETMKLKFVIEELHKNIKKGEDFVN